jgi:hypothetical protein
MPSPCPTDRLVLARAPTTTKGSRPASATPEAAPSPAVRLAILLALFTLPLVATVRPVAAPVCDPDVWWHLGVGRWVAGHGTVPAHDPFAAGHKAWVAYSWLYEVLVYGLYSWLGLAGLIVYRAGLSLAVVAALYRLVARREPHFLRAAGLTAAGTFALAPLLSERPWLFTILFTTLATDVVLDLRAGTPTRLAWLLPACFALWANIHIQFVYGLGVLGLACLAPIIDRLRRRPPEPGGPATAAAYGSAGWRRLVLLSGACALATLANPYHLRQYAVVLEYATQPGPYRFVNELKALEFREAPDWVLLALAAAAAFALGRRRRLDTFQTLLLAAAAVFAFRSRRDLWFLVVASLVVLASAGRRPVPAGARFRLTARRRLVLAALLVAVAALTGWVRDLREDRLQEAVAGVFPVEAAAVVAGRGLEGPLFNDFNWGGYLVWSLPHLPVALDGRTNLHGDERILRIGNTWAAGPGWQDDPDLAAAGVVVADVAAPLAGLLLQDERFALVHEDPVARVFVRRGRNGER